MHTRKARVVLGVCGSIACYKALEIVRLLTQKNIDVQVIMTQSATQFITPLSFETLSHNPVILDQSKLSYQEQIQHIELSHADLFLIAPASANTINKLAQGIADNLLLSTLLATQAPIYLAPAMNNIMYNNPLTQANIRKLLELKKQNPLYQYNIIPPIVGELACGVIGEGKMQEPEQIVAELDLYLSGSKSKFVPQDLQNKLVVVSAGSTQIPIDPVRFLSNKSSGRMGYAIAEAAKIRGAKVILIAGFCEIDPPSGVELIKVTQNYEMQAALEKYFPKADFLIQAAAICDYQVEYSPQKIKKNAQDLQITLHPAPDILSQLAQQKTHQCLVGFAAESENLLENARAKLQRKKIDFIVANDISRADIGFGSSENMGYLLSQNGKCIAIDKMDKLSFAQRIFDLICQEKQ